jgi:ribonuclease HII
MRHFEMVLWKSGCDIAGVDEVGIGPRQAGGRRGGRVAANGHRRGRRFQTPDAATRAHLAQTIRARASGIGIGTASVEEMTASTFTMPDCSPCGARSSIASASAARACWWTHARFPALKSRRICSTKATASITIAAASIIAKTERDGMMEARSTATPGMASPRTRLRDASIARRWCASTSAVHRMSFPVMHELRGEYSALFYVLKGQLEAARSRAALDELEIALRAQAEELVEQECKKLRLLVARRWKVIV